MTKPKTLDQLRAEKERAETQLAYSFDIALQNEFSLEENIALARQFLLKNFVSWGMVFDFAVPSQTVRTVAYQIRISMCFAPSVPSSRTANGG